MNVLVTGATGFIGTALVRRLAASGHTVTALSRWPERHAGQIPELAAVHGWQPLEGPPGAEAFAGVDAVVHLAGEPVDGRWTEKKKRAIRESRELGTRNLVTGMLAAPTPPPVLVSMSAIGIYGQRGDEEVTEDTPSGNDFLAGVARAWEAEAERATTAGVRVAILRNGLVFGRGGGAFERLLKPARLGAGGPLGGGRQWWSWVHLDDVVGVILHALEHDDVRGPLNVTSPNPQRQRDVAKALGRVLHRPAFVPAPAFALKLVLGEFSKEVLGSIRVLPRRTEASGYRFQHADLDEALRNLLA